MHVFQNGKSREVKTEKEKKHCDFNKEAKYSSTKTEKKEKEDEKKKVAEEKRLNREAVDLK